MAERISIGGKDGDAELVARIVQYQKENNFRYASDAVRSLCEIALGFKNLIKQ